MKKHLLTGLVAAAFVFAASSSLQANGTPVPDAVAEGVEISGAVDVVTGWQHDDQDAGAAGGLGAGAGVGAFFDYGAANAVNAANADHIRTVVNTVELDLEKSFGENIRLRSDIDFTELTDTGAAGVVLEQAYVTANLAAGNGIEFLIGRFNAPVGVESVDTRDNWTISLAPPLRHMIPAGVTGAKVYYAFSDLVDLHIAVVNDLNSNGFGDSALPSGLFRLGFNWGDEGQESTLGISGGAGPEGDPAAVAAFTGSDNAHLDFFGDLDLLLALSDTVSWAAEGVYRQSNAERGGPNQKAIAGFTALNYQASDVWDVTFKFGWLWDVNPPPASVRNTGTGASTTGTTWLGSALDGQLYSGTLGAGYAITDGAKLKLEGRYDWLNTSGGGPNTDSQSVLAQFAYTF